MITIIIMIIIIAIITIATTIIIIIIIIKYRGRARTLLTANTENAVIKLIKLEH